MLHGYYLEKDGWMVVNRPAGDESQSQAIHNVDADRLAMDLAIPKSVNLILLGFAVAALSKTAGETGSNLFCTYDDIMGAVQNRLKDNPGLSASAESAIETGARAAG